MQLFYFLPATISFLLLAARPLLGNSSAILRFLLDTFVPQVHSRKTLRNPPSGSMRGVMSYFCHQVSFTSHAWSRVSQNPDDRFEAVRAPIENLGGTIRAAFFIAGRFDVLAITEFPDEISISDICIAFARGGAVADIQTHPLLTAAQAIEAHSATPIPSTYLRKQAVAAAAGS